MHFESLSLTNRQLKRKKFGVKWMVYYVFDDFRTGRINYEIPLDLTKYLYKEANYLPWGVTSLYFSAISQLLSNRESFQNFSVNCTTSNIQNNCLFLYYNIIF